MWISRPSHSGVALRCAHILNVWMYAATAKKKRHVLAYAVGSIQNIGQVQTAPIHIKQPVAGAAHVTSDHTRLKTIFKHSRKYSTRISLGDTQKLECDPRCHRAGHALRKNVDLEGNTSKLLQGKTSETTYQPRTI